MDLLRFTKPFFIIFFCMSYAFTKAQDIIIRTDKTEIKSKVLEIDDDNIKYKKFEALDGPTYSVKKALVFMIIYKNGNKEYMDNATTQPSTKPEGSNPTASTPKIQAFKSNSVTNEETWSPLRLVAYYNSSSNSDGLGGSYTSTAINIEFTRDFKIVPDFFNIGLGPVVSILSASVPNYDEVGNSNGSTSSTSTGYGGLIYGNAYVSLNKLLNNNKSKGLGFYPFARLGYEYINFTSDGVSSGSGATLFELGIDYKFSKNFAVTVVTSKFDSFGGGLSFSF